MVTWLRPSATVRLPRGPRQVFSRYVSLPRLGDGKLSRVTPFARLATQVMNVDYALQAAAKGRKLPETGGLAGFAQADTGGPGGVLARSGGWRVVPGGAAGPGSVPGRSCLTARSRGRRPGRL